jgi:hypothetical protein
MNKKGKLIISLSVLFILVITITLVLAKYITNDDSNIGLSSKEFYFTSDYLDVEKTDKTFPEYILGKGVDDITFKLNNYIDDLQYTKTDIEYEVTVTDSSKNIVKVLTGSISKTDSKNSVEIKISDLTADTYIVVAKSTSPYSKTIKAKFTIQSLDEDITYVVSDASGSPIVQVTITVADFSGNINIKWPSGVTPDNNDPLLKDAVDCSEYKVYFNKYSEYTFVFFKTNSLDKFEKTDFEITK